MDGIKLVIIAGESGIRGRMAAAVERSPGIELVDSMQPTPDALARVSAAGADAVAIFYDGREELYELAERIYVGKSALCVVMLCQSPDAGVFSRAIASGVRQVLPLEELEESLASTVAQAVERERSRAGAVSAAAAGSFESKVIAVFGTKGGTGKTLFAVNMAVALAESGKRTAILDLDLQFGDVGIFLDIEKADSIADVVEESAFEYNALRSYLFTHASGLRGLCAPASPEYAELVLPEHIGKVIAALRPRCDYLILDLPPAFSDNTIAGLEKADIIYYVLNPDISTLRSSRVGMGIMGSLNLADRVHMILNKDGNSSIRQKDIEGALEHTVELTIPCDPARAIKSVNRGVPLVEGDRRSPISKAILDYVAKALLDPPAAKGGK